MRRYNDISIKHKLTSITMATAGAVLLLGCGSFLIYELIIMPRNIAHTLASLVSVTANSGAAALDRCGGDFL
jgi:hypothetical protein